MLRKAFFAVDSTPKRRIITGKRSLKEFDNEQVT